METRATKNKYIYDNSYQDKLAIVINDRIIEGHIVNRINNIIYCIADVKELFGSEFCFINKRIIDRIIFYNNPYIHAYEYDEHTIDLSNA